MNRTIINPTFLKDGGTYRNLCTVEKIELADDKATFYWADKSKTTITLENEHEREFMKYFMLERTVLNIDGSEAK